MMLNRRRFLTISAAAIGLGASGAGAARARQVWTGVALGASWRSTSASSAIALPKSASMPSTPCWNGAMTTLWSPTSRSAPASPERTSLPATRPVWRATSGTSEANTVCAPSSRPMSRAPW